MSGMTLSDDRHVHFHVVQSGLVSHLSPSQSPDGAAGMTRR